MRSNLETFPIAGTSLRKDVETSRRRDVLSFGRQRRAVVWTQAQHEMLRRELEAGKSASAAAAEINAQFSTHYTRSSVIGRAWRLGVQLRAPQSPSQARKRKRVVTVSPLPRITPDLFVIPAPRDEPIVSYRDGGPIGIFDLEVFPCRAVLDDCGDDGLAAYCGAEVVSFKTPYCVRHLALFYQTHGYVSRDWQQRIAENTEAGLEQCRITEIPKR
jgi:hypothetical protein